MTEEELHEMTRQLIKESTELVLKAVNDAAKACTARSSGRWEEYWKQVAADTKASLDEQYERFNKTQEE